jgi:hypothetical protein
MRTTLSLDDDVAALLQQIQKKRDATLKQVVNEALRRGLEHMTQPAVPEKPFRTQPVNLGKCYFPNLDNTWEVLAEAEGDLHK